MNISLSTTEGYIKEEADSMIFLVPRSATRRASLLEKAQLVETLSFVSDQEWLARTPLKADHQADYLRGG